MKTGELRFKVDALPPSWTVPGDEELDLLGDMLNTKDFDLCLNAVLRVVVTAGPVGLVGRSSPVLACFRIWKEGKTLYDFLLGWPFGSDSGERGLFIGGPLGLPRRRSSSGRISTLDLREERFKVLLILTIGMLSVFFNSGEAVLIGRGGS